MQDVFGTLTMYFIITHWMETFTRHIWGSIHLLLKACGKTPLLWKLDLVSYSNFSLFFFLKWNNWKEKCRKNATNKEK